MSDIVSVGDLLDSLPRPKSEPRPDTARDMNNPREGFWLVRPQSRGVFVAACIRLVNTVSEPGNPENVMDRSPFLCAFINENPVALDEVWLRRGIEISAEEYDLAILDALAGIYAKRTWVKKEA